MTGQNISTLTKKWNKKTNTNRMSKASINA